MAAPLMDLTGQKFARLTVIERDYSKRTTAWKCKCECGNYTVVTTKHLNGGQVKSCGGLNHEAKNFRHGLTHTRLYRIHQGMKRRCCSTDDDHYPEWGGRGITICKEWLGKNGFLNFREWALSHGYRDDLTIDRIDNNGNYEPANCRWATNMEQQNNTRVNAHFEIDGKVYTARQYAQEHNLTRGYVYEHFIRWPKRKLQGRKRKENK